MADLDEVVGIFSSSCGFAGERCVYKGFRGTFFNRVGVCMCWRRLLILKDLVDQE